MNALCIPISQSPKTYGPVEIQAFKVVLPTASLPQPSGPSNRPSDVFSIESSEVGHFRKILTKALKAFMKSLHPEHFSGSLIECVH